MRPAALAILSALFLSASGAVALLSLILIMALALPPLADALERSGF